MDNPKITPTVDEKSCCSGGYYTNKCCSSDNLRASIGRIAVGVLLLGSMFVFGMKAGMMGDRGGRGKKGGCWLGSAKQAYPMMNNTIIKGNTVNAPEAEEIVAPEQIPPTAEEQVVTGGSIQ